MDKLGPEHVNVATSYNNLASIYHDLGDFEQAKRYQQRALDIKLDKLGPEHVDVATSYNDLALIYHDLGDFEQAKEYLQRALDIDLDKLGPEHVNVATSYSNLALIYQDLRHFEQAKEYQQRALDIELDKLGPEHVDVACSYNNLASIYHHLGDFEQAKEYQQCALAIKADKHWLNKTPNKVHEGLLTDAKNYIMEIIFLPDRFYAVFKVYLVGVVLKFERLNFSGFFFFHNSISCVLNCDDRLCTFSSAVSIYEIHITL